jgi:Domain of unknown function (DUF4126)
MAAMDENGAGLFATQLAMGFALAASVGLRAFLPLFVAGVLARQGYLELGPSFQWMESTPALIVFGSALAFEILADKVPLLDHMLDASGAFVKPVAGTILAASLFTQLDPLVAATLGLVTGGTVAGVVHAAKSLTRVVSTSTTAGLGNPFLSLAEDAGATVGIVLAFLVPILAALVAVAIVALCVAALARVFPRRRPAPPGGNAGS